MAANVVGYRMEFHLVPDVGEAFALGFFLGLFLSLRPAEKIDEKYAVVFERGICTLKICPKLTTAPFETLKLQGYKVISNAILREKLISFYEDHFAKLEYNLNLDRDFAIEKVQPYFFRNFVMRVATSTDVDGGAQDWVPKDYEKIRAESYIANLCRFRADLLRRFTLPQYDSTSAALREILNEIDQELTDTS